jgi:hypothetical protein
MRTHRLDALWLPIPHYILVTFIGRWQRADILADTIGCHVLHSCSAGTKTGSEKLGPLDDLNAVIMKHLSPAFTPSGFLLSDENSLPLTNSNGQRQAPSALPLGPRKKPFVYMSISLWFLPRDAYHSSADSVIHLSPMDVTFVA